MSLQDRRHTPLDQRRFGTCRSRIQNFELGCRITSERASFTVRTRRLARCVLRLSSRTLDAARLAVLALVGSLGAAGALGLACIGRVCSTFTIDAHIGSATDTLISARRTELTFPSAVLEFAGRTWNTLGLAALAGCLAFRASGAVSLATLILKLANWAVITLGLALQLLIGSPLALCTLALAILSRHLRKSTKICIFVYLFIYVYIWWNFFSTRPPTWYEVKLLKISV